MSFANPGPYRVRSRLLHKARSFIISQLGTAASGEKCELGCFIGEAVSAAQI